MIASSRCNWVNGTSFEGFAVRNLARYSCRLTGLGYCISEVRETSSRARAGANARKRVAATNCYSLNN